MKNNRFKSLIVLLLFVTVIFGNLFTVTVHAKGLSKVVKKEYVRILEEYKKKAEKNANELDAGYGNPEFCLLDINNDGRKDLIVMYFVNFHFSLSSIYVNRGTKVTKSRVTNYDSYNQFDVLAGIKLYKNYLMAKASDGEHGGYPYKGDYFDYTIYTDLIYKTDKRGNLKAVCKHECIGLWGGDIDPIIVDHNYFKVIDGECKKMSKKEYNKFASKFKNAKYEWKSIKTKEENKAMIDKNY